MLQTHVFGVVTPPGVLTFHPYAKLVPPWSAAAIVAMESSELPHSWAVYHSGTLCLDCISQLSWSGAAT